MVRVAAGAASNDGERETIGSHLPPRFSMVMKHQTSIEGAHDYPDGAMGNRVVTRVSGKMTGPFQGISTSAGIALIEFIAVAAPVALLIFFLIADFGRVMRFADELAFCARVGVEYAYQTWKFGVEGNLSNGTRDAIITKTRDAIRTSDGATKYSSATVVVSKVCTCPLGYSMVPAGSACSAIDALGSSVRCTDYGLPQILFTVQISSTFTPVTPLISSIVGNSIVLTRTASHRVQ